MRHEQRICPLCNSKEYKLLFSAADLNYGTTDEVFDIVKCRGCDLVTISPFPEDMEKYYPSQYGPHQQKNTVSVKPSLQQVLRLFYGYPLQDGESRSALDKLRCFHKFLEVVLKNDFFFYRIPYSRNGRLLDIGCGNGSYLLYLKKLGWDAERQLFGVEFPNESITHIKKTEQLNIIEGDFMNAELPKEFFSFASMRHVLEHFSDPVAAMRKVHAILEPRGRVLIGIPNFRSLESRLLKGRWHHIDAPRHLYHFTPRTLRRLLTSSGFEVEKMHLKKSVSPAARSIEHYGITVSKTTKKHLLSNILKVSQLLGLSGELLCVAVKK